MPQSELSNFLSFLSSVHVEHRNACNDRNIFVGHVLFFHFLLLE